MTLVSLIERSNDVVRSRQLTFLKITCLEEAVIWPRSVLCWNGWKLRMRRKMMIW